MRKLRVAALIRDGLVPPDEATGYDVNNPPDWKMEFDIIATLREMGHDVRPIGLYDDLTPVRDSILNWKPHVAFMMLEEFHGVAQYDHAIVSYLELMKQQYTGCNARGLMLSHDKALSKKILNYHRVPTPGFAVFRRRRKIRPPAKLKYPILVKSATEDASFGISQKSIVHNDAALIERVKFVHEHVGSDALVEEYIEGRELYVGVMGNKQLSVFPVWEMFFRNMPDDVAHIATARVKWNTRYQKKHGIETGRAPDLTDEQTAKIQHICKRVYRALNMSGYGRIDIRMNAAGQVYVIEANANPNLEFGEDFAESAEADGISYEQLLTRVVNLGLKYDAAWRQ
ncbi:D-alanine--D-alanine ligase family protein [Fuerstiella marisgermanici]|uniref:D-alanine--D-alanine ligase B n=1 Tax=Fuerstiella marisgermanici TaxID=1891926 RepID=A0A1P8WBM9_9PLAN|nr:ATP-grasp domain-containing protein [Fuerstiella marisgermanici]APZ91446.1 D-alanine--D-alanine ligase B [Fuerstiella marisgermanici]